MAGEENSDQAPAFAAGVLRAFIERIGRPEEEKAAIGEDIKEIYAELRGRGFQSCL